MSVFGSGKATEKRGSPLSGDRFLYLPFLLGAAVFFVSILWINFHSAQWYNYDMYQDVLVAERMARQHTLFPERWIYGNQYYIIATPAVAALFYSLCGDGIASMALASGLMTLLILGCFLWCCAPFYSKRSLCVGLFCLSGAAVLGESASSSYTGMQLLYTMASYYACYLLGVLLHMGIYLRLRTGRRVHPALWALALLTALALGMQSLRETLVLHIPLLLLELYAMIRLGKNRRSGVFVLAGFAANLAGLALIRFMPVRSNVLYDPPAWTASFGALKQNLAGSSSALLGMTGLPYLQRSLQWKPLGLLALFFTAAAVGALLLALRKRDRSPGAFFLLFCVLSLAGVFATGVLLFRVRAVYFFIWILLVCLSLMTWSETLSRGRLRGLFLLAVLLAGAGGYVYNFYPDLKKYPEQSRFYTQAARVLYEEEDVNFVLVDFLTFPTVAACSDGKIEAGTFWYDFETEDDALLTPVSYLFPEELFEDIDPAHSMIVLSDSKYAELSSREYILATGSERYYNALMERLRLVRTLEGESVTLYFYRFDDPGLIRAPSLPPAG